MRFFFWDTFQTLAANIFEMLAWFCGRLPKRLKYFFVGWLGFAFGVLARNMRKSLQENLHVIFEMEKGELGSLSNTIFRNFAWTMCDFFLPDGIEVEVDPSDRAKVELLRKTYPGVLVLTFHLGHWELGARTMQSWGWPVTAVYQPYSNKKFKEVIEARRAPGVNFLPVGGTAATGVRDALRRGDVVAMLGDHMFGEDGAEVQLLGQKVMWPKGPVVLAVREQCPIVIAVVVRTELGKYKAFVEDPMIPQSKSRAEVQRLVQEVADKFGKFLPHYPSQWYRFRRFDFVK